MPLHTSSLLYFSQYISVLSALVWPFKLFIVHDRLKSNHAAERSHGIARRTQSREECWNCSLWERLSGLIFTWKLLLHWLCFTFCIEIALLLLKVSSSNSGSLCQRWVMDDLMVLCPVYCVYNVLADISTPLGERSTSYLQSYGTRNRESEWEREMQAEGRERENIKRKQC